MSGLSWRSTAEWREAMMTTLCDLRPSQTARWYLIHTKPAAESIAEANLGRQGFRVYYPRLLRTVCIRARRVSRVAPLFPRYLFLSLDVGNQTMAPVRSTVGVADIVRFGYAYAAVPSVVVTELQGRSDPVTGLHSLRQAQHEPGAAVTIVGGVFDGLEGIFHSRCGSDRVVVLLKLLGREAPVRIPTEFVLPQTSAPLASY
jgi:transcriptional antiterminator RfaH